MPSDAAIQKRAEELLDRYPYDPSADPARLPRGPEQLRAVPPGLREIAAPVFARRWFAQEIRPPKVPTEPAPDAEEAERRYP